MVAPHCISTKLTQRLLRRANLSRDALPNDLGAWQGLLDRINRFYEEQARDRYLLERSLEVSSREMQALYYELRRSSASEVAAERRRERKVAVAEARARVAERLQGTGRLE